MRSDAPNSQVSRTGSQSSDRRSVADRVPCRSRVDLTPAQSKQVDSLMSAQAPKFRALREKMEPAMDSLVKETQAQMDRILTPAQQAKAKAMREERATRHRRGGPPA